jgi:flagellar FliL protein
MAARPDNKTPEEKLEKPRKRGKGLWIGTLVTLLVAAGVAAGWYFTRPAAQPGDDAAQATEKPAEAIFVKLDAFTVNLADEGGERLAQVALILELGSQQAQAALTKNLPVVRNGILLLLSSQHTRTLLTLDGKIALANEVAVRTGTALGWKPQEPQADEAEDESPSPARKVTNRKPKKRVRQEPNPVVAVHFAQLLVQ